MARIEVDPNYSSPTFSRATAATDPFKKEDVQGVAAAMSTHDHSSGKGLAVLRLGTLNQDVSFSNSGAKLMGDLLTVTPLSANTSANLDVMSTGSGTNSILHLYPTSTKLNTHMATFMASATEVLIASDHAGSGAYGAITLRTSGVNRLYIDASGSLTLSGTILLDGNTTMSGSTTLTSYGIIGTQYVQSNTGTFYFGAGGAQGYLAQAGGYIITRSASGLNVNDLSAAAAPVTCSRILIGAPPNAADIVLSQTTGPKISVYDLGGGAYCGLHIVGGEFGLTTHSGWNFTFRAMTSTGTVLARVYGDGSFTTSAAYSPFSPTIQTAGYAISTQNIANINGSVLAQAHPLYSCVDHAREYGLSVAEIPTPTAKVMALNPYAYDHMHLVRLQEGEALTPVTRSETDGGGVVSTPTYGFAASEVYAAIPEAAALDEDGTPIGVDDYRLLCVLWSSVQDLTNRLIALEAPKAA